MAQQYTKQQLANLAHDMAIKYNLPRPDMFVRQIIAESNLNPNAVSPVKAAGIAQFMPDTGLQYGLRPEDRFDPVKSLDAAARYMRDLTKQFKGDQYHATGAYNAGAAGYARNLAKNQARGGTASITIPETRDYMAKIWNSNTDVDKAMRLAGVAMPLVQKPANTSMLVSPAMYGDSIPTNVNTSNGGRFMAMSLTDNLDKLLMADSDDKYARLLDKANQQSALGTLQAGNYAESLNATNAQAASLMEQAQNVVNSYQVRDSATLEDLNSRAAEMAAINKRNDDRYAGSAFDGTIGGTLSNIWNRLAGGVQDQSDYNIAKNRAMDAAGVLHARNQAANIGNSAIGHAASTAANAATVAERGLSYEASPLAARSQIAQSATNTALQGLQMASASRLEQDRIDIARTNAATAQEQVNQTAQNYEDMRPIVMEQKLAAADASRARADELRAKTAARENFFKAATELGIPNPDETTLKDKTLVNAISHYTATGALASHVVDALKVVNDNPNIIPPETTALFEKLIGTAGLDKRQIKKQLASRGINELSSPEVLRAATDAAIKTVAQRNLLALKDSGTGGGLTNPWRMTAAEMARYIYTPRMDTVHNIGKVRALFTANPAPSDAKIISALSDGLPKDKLVTSVTAFFREVARGNEQARKFGLLALPKQDGYKSGAYDLTNPANAVIVANLAARQIPVSPLSAILNTVGLGTPPSGGTASGTPFNETEYLGVSK